MKIDKDSIQFIQRVLAVAKLAGTGNIAIEPNRIRAMDDTQTAMIYHVDDVPEFDFGAIGINRIDVFSNRYNMVSGSGAPDIDAEVITATDGSTFVRSLTMKHSKIKVEYRCANPAAIRAPKKPKNPSDFEIKYSFNSTPDMIDVITKGKTAMATQVFRVVNDGDNIKVVMEDDNRDTLEYVLTTDVSSIGDDVEVFDFAYPIQLVLPLLKEQTTTFHITNTGHIRMNVKGLDTYIMQRT